MEPEWRRWRRSSYTSCALLEEARVTRYRKMSQDQKYDLAPSSSPGNPWTIWTSEQINRSFAILRSLRKLEGLWVGHIKLFGRRQLELHLRQPRPNLSEKKASQVSGRIHPSFSFDSRSSGNPWRFPDQTLQPKSKDPSRSSDGPTGPTFCVTRATFCRTRSWTLSTPGVHSCHITWRWKRWSPTTTLAVGGINSTWHTKIPKFDQIWLNLSVRPARIHQVIRFWVVFLCWKKARICESRTWICASSPPNECGG